MKFYQVKVGTSKFSVMALNLVEAKQTAQYCKMTRDLKGKTSVKVIGYINH